MDTDLFNLPLTPLGPAGADAPFQAINSLSAAGLDFRRAAITTEEAKHLRAPFDPDQVKFKPGIKIRGTKKSQAMAHADIRAYEDRLNTVFGAGSWHTEVTHMHLERPAFDVGLSQFGLSSKPENPEPGVEGTEGGKTKWDPKDKLRNKAYFNGMVGISVRLYIRGIPVAENVGDGPADDENFLTSPFAQAFKRACSQIGLGRYLYELPKIECLYDYGKWVVNPGTVLEGVILLPDDAVPEIPCEECGQTIKSTRIRNKSTNTITTTSRHAHIVISRRQLGGKTFCAACQRKAKEIQPAESAA